MDNRCRAVSLLLVLVTVYVLMEMFDRMKAERVLNKKQRVEEGIDDSTKKTVGIIVLVIICLIAVGGLIKWISTSGKPKSIKRKEGVLTSRLKNQIRRNR